MLIARAIYVKRELAVSIEITSTFWRLSFLPVSYLIVPATIAITPPSSLSLPLPLPITDDEAQCSPPKFLNFELGKSYSDGMELVRPCIIEQSDKEYYNYPTITNDLILTICSAQWQRQAVNSLPNNIINLPAKSHGSLSKLEHFSPRPQDWSVSGTRVPSISFNTDRSWALDN